MPEFGLTFQNISHKTNQVESCLGASKLSLIVIVCVWVRACVYYLIAISVVIELVVCLDPPREALNPSNEPEDGFRDYKFSSQSS